MKKKNNNIVLSKDLRNPFDDSLKQSLDPNSSPRGRLRSSQRYIDDDNNKSQNSDDQQNHSGNKNHFSS